MTYSQQNIPQQIMLLSIKKSIVVHIEKVKMTQLGTSLQVMSSLPHSELHW